MPQKRLDDVHKKQMRAFFERDRKDAKESKHILGIRVWPRDDGYWAGDPCPRAAGFSGVFLPDELPELYPDDCPDENACCCLNREMVLASDNSEAGTILREKMAKRGMPPPPPPWNYERELAEVEAMEREKSQRMAAVQTAVADVNFEVRPIPPLDREGRSNPNFLIRWIARALVFFRF